MQASFGWWTMGDAFFWMRNRGLKPSSLSLVISWKPQVRHILAGNWRWLWERRPWMRQVSCL